MKPLLFSRADCNGIGIGEEFCVSDRGSDPESGVGVHGAGEAARRNASDPTPLLPRLAGSGGVAIRCRRRHAQSVARRAVSQAASDAPSCPRRLHRRIGTGRRHRSLEELQGLGLRDPAGRYRGSQRHDPRTGLLRLVRHCGQRSSRRGVERFLARRCLLAILSLRTRTSGSSRTRIRPGPRSRTR